MSADAATARIDSLIDSRGAATLADLQLSEAEALALVRERPELEPVFLVRFRSRQDKVRVQEVRAFAWPSDQIGLRHLGYRSEDARLLRLEPRERVPFPAALYARFEQKPAELEALRLAEKEFAKAIKQAASKPGRAEQDLTALQAAFAKLGQDVVLEMWIEAASAFQEVDNAGYAGRMLGNLLKVASSDAKIDVSLLGRTVLTAADHGVFNTRLYEFTWEALQKRVSTPAALGFGVRVFRRLIASGRPLPVDFIKDLQKAAAKDKVADFDGLFDGSVLWAAGQSSFWNTAKKAAGWRDSATGDHAETERLRDRLRQLWARSYEAGDVGEPWRASLWGRIRSTLPEVTSYGRTLLVENLLTVGGPHRPDHERLLEATLAMATRAPLGGDRSRTEVAAETAMFRLADLAPDVFREHAAALDGALRATTGDLTTFLALYDLLGDVSDRLPPGDPVPLLASLPGTVSAWTGALSAALKPPEGRGRRTSAAPPIGAFAEGLKHVTPATAGEFLAEIGPAVSSALATALAGGTQLAAWGRTLGSLRALGPVGVGVIAAATEKFVAAAGADASFGHAGPLAHLLDTETLRQAAESRSIVDEAIAIMATRVGPASRAVELVRPELEGVYEIVVDAIGLPDGSVSLLWGAKTDAQATAGPLMATTLVGPDGSQRTGQKLDTKSALLVRQWATPKGLRLVAVVDQKAVLIDPATGAVLGSHTFETKSHHSYKQIVTGPHHALVGWGPEAALFDADFKLVEMLEGANDWSRWRLLDNVEPMVVALSHHGPPSIWAAPDRLLPAPKMADAQTWKVIFRTDDGAIQADYDNNRGQRRRARYDEARKTWVASDGSARPARPVVAMVSASAHGWEPITLFDSAPWLLAGDGQFLIVQDLLGATQAVSIHRHDQRPIAWVPGTGTMYSQTERLTDPSLPVRLKVSSALQSLITKRPEEPLPLAAYGDANALVEHIVGALARRPGGEQVLEDLGEYARPLVEAAARVLATRLAVREEMLRRIEGPPPPPSGVPPRVAGVQRSALRRAVRTYFAESAPTETYWALDGRDPGPLLETLFASDGTVSHDALPTAIRLLAMAQTPGTDLPIAERALNLVEAIGEELARPERRFAVERVTESAEVARRRGWERTDQAVVARSLESLRHPLLMRPSGSFPKGSPPVPLPEGIRDRLKVLREWVSALLQPLSLQRFEVVTEGPEATHYIGHVRHDGCDLGVEFRLRAGGSGTRFSYGTALTLADGIRWQLDTVFGSAPSETWGGLFQSLSAILAPLPCENDTAVWAGRGAVLPDDIAALRGGVAFTRSILGNRDVLDPLTWSAPAVEGLAPAESRAVMLAWLLGGVHPSAVGSTGPAFERIAGKGKLVQSSYTGLNPKGSPSAEYARVVRLGLWHLSTPSWQNHQPRVVLLTEPSRLAEAFAREVGIKPGGPS